MKISDIPSGLLARFRRGMVIPAHPLSLTEDRCIDENDMAIMARYYIDAGVGGIAIGVHTTQFEIRDPHINLFESVLKLTSDNIDAYSAEVNKPIMKIGGVCGTTDQAVREAKYAESLGFHAVLLSLAALKDQSIDEMVDHCRAVSDVMPIIGFYLQPAVGGRALPYEFWQKFACIENVLGIKMAPFNRYQTIDVVRGVCAAGRATGDNAITLYTGNDDNIVVDLLTPYECEGPEGKVTVRIKGGLLGHWCVWTRKAVELLEEIHAITEHGKDIPQSMLTKNISVTDSNGVFFDVANDFAGCIPGVHEILRRQGLMKHVRCLNPDEVLSPGQSEEIDRLYATYSDLHDDAFVADNLKRWKDSIHHALT